MDAAELAAWVDRYERLWRTSGTEGLDELFSDDVTYLASPWAEPIRGLVALADLWDNERDGHDEQFTLEFEVVATDGPVGVARVEVVYGEGSRWRDLWIVRLGDDGRCTAFEEWPFAPGQSDGHE